MNRIASHLNRIQSGAIFSFNNVLQELDVATRIDVMMDLLLLDAKISEHVINSRASSTVAAEKFDASPSKTSEPVTKHAPHVIVSDRKFSLLAPTFFPEQIIKTRSKPIAA